MDELNKSTIDDVNLHKFRFYPTKSNYPTVYHKTFFIANTPCDVFSERAAETLGFSHAAASEMKFSHDQNTRYLHQGNNRIGKPYVGSPVWFFFHAHL